ncbi:tetratricopeptide repeat-containing protein [Cardiosporidium cionae]|uniref:Tetratricopeptide repeat-containing protein n=1 Tax=Cardiosporidium cionae TaxID=476202 RepID=A0ABQ7J6M7_9APIC|nr:tetratricopeptide repeat-containing protein [Cardiosporidium cionae]|eukprot:KAF8819638.1 tetratricopeptide repeat-containing protein [Cardiosporidium cionae]
MATTKEDLSQPQEEISQGTCARNDSQSLSLPQENVITEDVASSAVEETVETHEDTNASTDEEDKEESHEFDGLVKYSLCVVDLSLCAVILVPLLPEKSSHCCQFTIGSFLICAKGMTAQDLFNRGKDYFCKEKDYDRSTDFFSRAVERKKQELETEEETHIEMACYYLWYGDSLLTKEEQKNDLFEFLRGRAVEKEELVETKKEEDEEISDEQLAFEILELARCSYELRKESEISSNEVMDWSFVHIRLGDIQLMNEHFEEAMHDYKEAVSLRQKFLLPKESIIAPSLSLAQSRMFSGLKKEGLKDFEFTLELIENVLNHHLDLPSGTTIKTMEDSAEDLRIQITDLKKTIQEEEEKGIEKHEKGSQSEAKGCIPITTSTLDPPSLSMDEKHTHLKVIPSESVSSSSTNSKKNSLESISSNPNERKNKIRRIDLSKI